MKNVFNEHPHNVGETYWQHLYHAMRFGGSMIIGGIACCIHAIFPFVFEKTGSNYLLRLTNDFIYRMPNADGRVFMFVESINRKVRVENPVRHKVREEVE